MTRAKKGVTVCYVLGTTGSSVLPEYRVWMLSDR